jgi:hypothetical protein
MNGWKRRIRTFLAALFGALGGSLPALGCTGGCGSCFSCAGVGVIAVIAAVAAAGKRKKAAQGGGEHGTPQTI